MTEGMIEPASFGTQVETRFTYPAAYRPKCLAEQVARLKSLFFFQRLGGVSELQCQQRLPQGAEGWFAIPRWDVIASTYGEAVKKVTAKIGKVHRKRIYYSWHRHALGSEYLRRHGRVEYWWRQIASQQGNRPILVVPAQFGFLHRGRSVQRARALMRDDFEFGLGAFEVGIMLLTHPERLVYDGRHNGHWIDCPGDEYSWAADGVYDNDAPRFSSGYSNELVFGTNHSYEAAEYSAPASAFISWGGTYLEPRKLSTDS
ncbi:MAG: hypothetical protein IVW54_18575 [Candidatus Binataceae bacterium]|nr:hypothetical protein [Candidatus Binataceae bacterium]